MTFPDTPLGVKVELDLAGTWTDITGYVRLDPQTAIVLTRGRPDGAQSANPSTAAMTWNNIDGRFSPRNPTGPYYGKLGRNTPVRISIPASGTSLRFEGDNASNITCPDSAGVSVTGDIDVRLDLELTGYGNSLLCDKYVHTGNERSWELVMYDDGTLYFAWSTDGTAANVVSGRSAVPIPLGRVAVRATVAVATGTLTFYTAPDMSGAWTQLGDPVVLGATSIFDSTAPITIGYNAEVYAYNGYQTLQGSVYGFQLLSGIGGTLAASPDFTTATPGAASLTDAQGNVWTLSGAAEFSDRDYRFHGECASLPQQWNAPGENVWTPVTAAGLLRRLAPSSAPLQSAMTRGWQRVTGALAPVAYWPCEDASTSAQVASGLPGGEALQAHGALSFASDSSFPGSAPVIGLNGANFRGDIPAYTSPATQAIVLRFLLHIPAGGDTTGGTIARIYTSGTVHHLEMGYATGGALSLTGYDRHNSSIFSSGNIAFNANGEILYAEMALVQNGTGLDWHINTLKLGSPLQYGVSATVPSATVGIATGIAMGANDKLTATGVGQVTVQTYYDPTGLQAGSLYWPFNAWEGETAADRFSRLCSEEGLAYRIYGYPATSVAMGAQPADTFANLLQECEAADNGMIYEPLASRALGYRTLNSMCAQSPALSMDYGELSPPLTPIDDDRYTQNDITASRSGGSSYRATLDDGSAMSISQPPAGVGDYQNSAQVNVESDSQLPDAAYWLLNLGTTDEERYPSIAVDLTARNLAPLFYTVLGAGMGDYIEVTGLPAWLPPDGIQAIIWGATEVLGDKVCNVAWQTQPESPYETFVAGESRAETDGSTLALAASAGTAPAYWDFQAGTDGWSASYATVAQSRDWPGNGRCSLLVTADGTGTSFWQAFSPQVSCSPGDLIAVTAAVKAISALAAVKLSLHFGGTADTYITTPGVPMGAGQETELLVSGTAPASATYWQIAVVDSEASPAGAVMLADLVVGGRQDTLTAVPGGGPGWTQDPADLPFDITAAGERMTVTGVGAGPPQCKVGAYLNPGALGVSTWAQAAAIWQGWTGVTPPVGRVYLANAYPYNADMQAMVAAGTRMLISIQPDYSPVSPSTLAAITTWLQTLQAAGADCKIAMWPEPYYSGLTAAQLQAVYQYYGPTIRQYFPLVFVTSTGSVFYNNELSYYPGDAWVDEVATDFYCGSPSVGSTLDAAVSPADNANPPKPFGIWEFNGGAGQTTAQTTAFMQYIQSYMSARLALGKVNSDISLFNGAPGKSWFGNGGTAEAGFEGGSPGNWTSAGNCTIAPTTAQAHSPGSYSLAITSAAAGNAQAASCTAASILTQGMPCAAGDTVTGAAWLRAAATSRSCQVGIGFYDATGAALSSTYGTSVADTTTGWTQVSVSATAPANAAYARLLAQALATGAAGEVHYVDDAELRDVTGTNATLTTTIEFGWDYRIALWQAIYAALNDTSTAQTLTVTRSVNGVVKTHNSGEKVALFSPARAGLA